jgi:uncharacterized membrane protein
VREAQREVQYDEEDEVRAQYIKFKRAIAAHQSQNAIINEVPLFLFPFLVLILFILLFILLFLVFLFSSLTLSESSFQPHLPFGGLCRAPTLPFVFLFSFVF